MVAPKITKEELKRMMDMHDDFTLLDVRNPVDYGRSDIKITGGVRIPLEELEGRIVELDPEREVVAYCT